MDDLISRQEAIDAIGAKSDEIYKTKQAGATFPHYDLFQGMAYAADIVENMPSAQSEIIRCKDCKYRKNANCERFGINRYTQSNSYCSWAERKES